MEQQFSELPGWTFLVQEVSAGVYRVVARDRSGRSFEAKGLDSDALIQRAREYARQFVDNGDQ